MRACVCLCAFQKEGVICLLDVCVSCSPWTTLNSHLTCVYLSVSSWADITSVVWSVEVERMSRKCHGWRVLLKRKVFIPSLQTADRSSDSPACLAVSCFKAVWTLGLCRSRKAVIAGLRCGQVSQPSLSFHFWALARLLIRSCYAGIVLFLICLWPAKGLTASVSLTPLQALWAPHYSFREENIAIRLLCPQRARAHLPMPAWLL